MMNKRKTKIVINYLIDTDTSFECHKNEHGFTVFVQESDSERLKQALILADKCLPSEFNFSFAY